MTFKTLIFAVAVVISAGAAAFAQSGFTTGTAASTERAGYPVPGGYGAGLYAYATGYGGSHIHKGQWRLRNP